jgi:LPXTG-motif cell wall-anchored protein
MERIVIRSRARRLGGLIPLTVAALLAASISETHATTSSPTQVGNDINGEAAGDYSGWSVAMSDSGTRIAIGAPYNGGTGSNAGHVRVYDLIGNTWTQVGADINGEAAGDYSGYSVAMSANGTRIAIGAAENGGVTPGSSVGHVRVYDLIGNTWTQVGADIDGEAAYDGSGRSVAMSDSGTRIAIGAPYNGGSGSYAGHVRVYDLIGNTWTKVGNDIDGEAAYDQSGFSVAMSANGTRIAIGATFNDGTATDAGHIRIYDLIGNTWTQVGADIDGEATNDYSGRSVAMSANGTRIAIGAMGNDGTATDAGHVRIYDLIGTTWTQVGADIDGEAAGDYAGFSVAMSDSGTRIAIGATGNDGTAPNDGHVRIYDLIGTTWTQVGTDIDGEATGDASGRSVAMSANGTQVAIGAIANDGTASNAGHVRVYTPQANPSAPTINSVTAGNGSLSVAFTAGTDGGSAITNYKYSTDGTTYTALSPASTSSPFTISGLTNGTSYSITIKAVNAVGDSTASNAMTGTPTAPATTTTTTTIAPTTSTTVVASSNTGGGATTSTTPTTTQGLPETGDDSSNLTTLAIMLLAIGIVIAARRRSTTA